MTLLVIIFGALIFLAGFVILINPETVFGYMRDRLDKLALQIAAVTIRLILGALLIYQADVSRFPTAIEIIGWISLGAALFIIIIGRRNFTRLMEWSLSFVKRFGRFAGVMAAAFGAFLIYAFV
jgi:hypothetical protein